MKVIVFGGAGFLGSHVADELINRGHQTLIFDLVKSPYLKKGQKGIVGDITDQAAVAKAVKGCDIVYNFAGIGDIEQAKINPLDTVKNNIMGNCILLEASRKNKIKRFVLASTLYVYSKTGSFYRTSKQSSELLIENYAEIYGLNYTILRYGSLYGPRAGKDNWIYKVLKQVLLEKKITRNGDGDEIREYIHVYDAARLSVDILDNEYKNEQVIITGNQQIKIKDIMIMIKEMLDNKIKLEFLPVSYSEHYEITPYSFKPNLARRMQSSHYIDLGQGLLESMAEIYKDHFPHKKHNGFYVKP